MVLCTEQLYVSVLFSPCVSIPLLADFRLFMWLEMPRTVWCPTTISQEWIKWCLTLVPGRNMLRHSKLEKVSKRKLWIHVSLFIHLLTPERKSFYWTIVFFKVLRQCKGYTQTGLFGDRLAKRLFRMLWAGLKKPTGDSIMFWGEHQQEGIALEKGEGPSVGAKAFGRGNSQP